MKQKSQQRARLNSFFECGDGAIAIGEGGINDRKRERITGHTRPRGLNCPSDLERLTSPTRTRMNARRSVPSARNGRGSAAVQVQPRRRLGIEWNGDDHFGSAGGPGGDL